MDFCGKAMYFPEGEMEENMKKKRDSTFYTVSAQKPYNNSRTFRKIMING